MSRFEPIRLEPTTLYVEGKESLSPTRLDLDGQWVIFVLWSTALPDQVGPRRTNPERTYIQEKGNAIEDREVEREKP